MFSDRKLCSRISGASSTARRRSVTTCKKLFSLRRGPGCGKNDSGHSVLGDKRLCVSIIIFNQIFFQFDWLSARNENLMIMHIFSGNLSPKNLQSYASRAIATTQSYAIQTYDWLYEKVQTLSKIQWGTYDDNAKRIFLSLPRFSI